MQFVLADNRQLAVGSTISINNYSANISANPDSTAYQYGYTDGKFAVVTASFIANEANFEFRLRPVAACNSTASKCWPSPTGAALLGGLGMLCLLRRRR